MQTQTRELKPAKKVSVKPARRFSGKAWIKPKQSPLVRLTADLMIKEHGEATRLVKQTGMTYRTIKGVRERLTGQPNSSTLEFILKYYGKRLAIVDDE